MLPKYAIDTSGNFHVITDVFDVHNYFQDSMEFESLFDGLKNDVDRNTKDNRTFSQNQL